MYWHNHKTHVQILHFIILKLVSSRIYNDFKKSLCGTGISAKSYDYRSKVSFLIYRNTGLDLWYLIGSYYSCVLEDKSLLLLCASRRFLRPKFSWGYWGRETVREKVEKDINMGKNSSLLSTVPHSAKTTFRNGYTVWIWKKRMC